jgi:alpha-N-arabinofuranosidase
MWRRRSSDRSAAHRTEALISNTTEPRRPRLRRIQLASAFALTLTFLALTPALGASSSAALAAPAKTAQDDTGIKAELTIHADQPQWKIDRGIYGQFAEHLGHGIYGGLWVGEDSPIPNTRGLRKDVVAALKNLKVPVVRWPGGCFADEYHWRAGIGPREQRPVSVNTNWGNVTDANAFGTHEFMDLMEQLGSEAYVSVNVGSGTPQEARDWVEYMTSDSDSTLANLRRRNGRDKPWQVSFLGVGNEPWGCGGNMRPEYYADEYRRYQSFLHSANGNIARYASGANVDDYQWTEVLMRQAGTLMDGISLHYYTIPSGRWTHKGAATGFDEAAWAMTLNRTLRMQELLQKHGAVMDRYDADKKVALAVDEWGTWYDVEPGTNPGFLSQQNTLRDAMVAALNLNIFHAHGDRVKMANIAQMVNVLQAMILTDGGRMLLTPTYHVFEMYKVHQDATYLPVDVASPPYRFGDVSIPAISASASRDAAGKLHVSLVNVDPHRRAQLAVHIAGLNAAHVSGRVLSAAAMDAHNSFDQPDALNPATFTDARFAQGILRLNLPPQSVVVLELH